MLRRIQALHLHRVLVAPSQPCSQAWPSTQAFHCAARSLAGPDQDPPGDQEKPPGDTSDTMPGYYRDGKPTPVQAQSNMPGRKSDEARPGQMPPNWDPPGDRGEKPQPRKANIPDFGGVAATSPTSERGLTPEEQKRADADRRVTAHPFDGNEAEAGIPEPKASPHAVPSGEDPVEPDRPGPIAPDAETYGADPPDLTEETGITKEDVKFGDQPIAPTLPGQYQNR